MISVSCIIPVFNVGKKGNWNRFSTLLKSLSLASKKLMTGQFEIIIVDDDPPHTNTDDIKILLSYYNMLDCSIVVSNEGNRGQAFSRNIGSQLASKKYLHFIDQDDFVDENIYSVISKTRDADFFIFLPIFFYENNSKYKKGITFITEYIYRRASSSRTLWPLMVSNVVFSPGQVLIKRDVFNYVGRFPLLVNRGSDDYALFYNIIFSFNTRVLYVDKAIFYYRIHEYQNSKSLNMSNSIKEFFTIRRCYTKKERLIETIKTNKHLEYLKKFLYMVFFKRASRSI